MARLVSVVSLTARWFPVSAYPIGSACDRTWHTVFVEFSIT